MAAGKKLFLSRSVCDLRPLHLFPDGSGYVQVRGVLDYAGCISETAGSVDGVSGWEAGLSDGLGFVHVPLKILT